MNNADYLNQIAAETRQAKPQTSFLDGFPLPKNLIKWLLITFVALIFIIILGAILSNQKDPERDLIDRINQRSTNLNSMISTYNPQIKSTRLRAISNNISSVLTYTQAQTTTILETYFGTEDKKGNKNAAPSNQSLIDEETAYIEEINASLENARIQATLDRTYHRTLTREVGYLLSLEAELLNRTRKEDLQSTLNDSAYNLDSLYTELQDFTDPTL